MRALTCLRWIAAWIAALAPLAASAQTSQTIPLIVHWSAPQPHRVSLTDDGGVSELTHDASSTTFTGTLAVPNGLVEQRTLLLNLDNDTFALILNVRKSLSRVEFTVTTDRPPSCADLLVRQVEAYTDNITDALKMMLRATAMLKIPPDDQCVADRLPRTIKARFDRNANLVQYSNGLFAIDPEAKTALLRSGIRSAPALAMAAEHNASSALAKGLYSDLLATGADDSRAASALAADMSSAVAQNETLAAGFKDQGISAKRLEKDSDFFEAKARVARPD
ncbi:MULTISPECIES: hypothetical protein [Sphingomonas]|jgi:hypothetical protein